MRRFLVITASLALLPVPARAVDPGPADLQGDWLEVLKPDPSPPRLARYVTVPRTPTALAVRGFVFTETQNGSALPWLVRVVPGPGPKALDLVTVSGGEFWPTKAIYKVEGDILTICDSAKDQPRPTAFDRGSMLDPRPGDDKGRLPFARLRAFKRLKPSDPKVGDKAPDVPAAAPKSAR